MSEANCRPWAHKWSKWKVLQVGQLTNTNSLSPQVVGFYETQRRECEKCGMSQLREVRA